ncbi:MalY/PatB family protein [Pseudoclavibacter soli]|uniref:MalY/PatB family protein n=1 Tax=Pseudoclavibacter soli TaxID=452623 RepID=UPI0003FCB3BA|nr:aminotransferase class I/II-fold pyridoxal phosphate-dependent enzyme [Pseudoclavibacter soli]
MTDFEQVDIDRLIRAGANKWTAIPGQIGTFVAESDYGTAPAVLDALRTQIDAQNFGYSTGTQKQAALDAVVSWLHDRFSWQIDRRQVALIPEVLTGLEVVLERHTRPGSPVIVPTPTYMPIFDLIRDHGREVIQVPLLHIEGRWQFDLAGIERALSAGAGLVLLLNPHNPTGQVFDRADLLALSQVVSAHEARVWADEVWAPLIFDDRPFIPYASLSEATARHTITTTSVSKGWNIPGLKTAQLVYTNDHDLEVWRRTGRWIEHTTGFLGIIATAAALNDGREWLDELRTHLQGNRDLFVRLVSDFLPEAHIVIPQATYLAWIDLSAYQITPSLRTFFSRNAKVALTAGEQCGEGYEQFVRVNFATPRPVISEIVHRLATAVRER